MLKRLYLTIVTLVAAGAALPAAAPADQRVGIGQAKKAVRSTLDTEFTKGGGVRNGSIDLTCKRDGAIVRCGVRMRDRRGRRWCGHSSVRSGRAGGEPITITRYNVRMVNCGRA